MPTTLYVRADGDARIGLGHLVRCMSLAFMLKNEFAVHFVSRSAPVGIREEIKKAGFTFTEIASENDFLESLLPDDVVVLDHYGLGTEYQRMVKQKGCKLVCIDDLHDKEFYADLIINHAPGISVQDYKTEPFTQLALGLDYALLKPAFLAAARQAKERTGTETLFICFGGADPINLTQIVLRNVLKQHRFKTIIVVTGSAYRYHEQLKAETAWHPVVEYYNSLKDTEMLKLMIRSDFAIVPSSGILLECLAAGCKVVASSYVDNQRRILDGLTELNAVLTVPDFKSLPDTIFSELALFKTKKVIDGNSGKRILNLFQEL